MSKIALVQHVARDVLQLEDLDPSITSIMRGADAAHVRWQTDGADHWACCDLFVKGEPEAAGVIRASSRRHCAGPTFRWAMSRLRRGDPASFRAR